MVWVKSIIQLELELRTEYCLYPHYTMLYFPVVFAAFNILKQWSPMFGPQATIHYSGGFCPSTNPHHHYYTPTCTIYNTFPSLKLTLEDDSLGSILSFYVGMANARNPGCTTRNYNPGPVTLNMANARNPGITTRNCNPGCTTCNCNPGSVTCNMANAHNPGFTIYNYNSGPVTHNFGSITESESCLFFIQCHCLMTSVCVSGKWFHKAMSTSYDIIYKLYNPSCQFNHINIMHDTYETTENGCLKSVLVSVCALLPL